MEDQPIIEISAPSSMATAPNVENNNPSADFAAVEFQGILDNYPDILTAQDLAEILRVNIKTAYGFCEEWGEQIGAKPVGRQYRILKTAVIKWFTDAHRSEERRKKPWVIE
ncbi:helix-turn-helix domain-containing protein [Myxococcota bacterium]|nr:helix-turn-helix domain-containing protein [Myxococcota bacterium]